MCTKTLSCILCGQPNFPSVDALRVSLLKVTARPLKCPICGDELLGLDKLTIHLFGHSLLEEQQKIPSTEEGSKNDTKRNSSNPSESLTNQRKMRKKGSAVAESNRSENGSDIGWAKMSPATENSQCSSNAPYCAECDVEFRNPALLKMHREVFHEEGTVSMQAGGLAGVEKRFVCHICPKEFKMKGSLKIHMRVVHSGSSKMLEGAKRTSISQAGVTSCITPSANTCTSTLNAVGMTNDVTVTNDFIPSTMSIHMLDQQQNIAVFQPPQSTEDGLGAPPERHIIQIIDPSQLAQVVYMPPNSAPTPCVDQDKQIAAPPLSQESSQHLVESPTPSMPSSPQQLGQLDNSKQWECDVCHKTFTTKYFLKKHNRLHTGEMPYTCGICGKSFTFQQSYHKHLLYHSDEKPHVCSVCNRAFKELSTLHNHERIHSGEKPFACETCGKCFRQRVSYLVHRRIHTGLMPYKCSGCDKSFRYKVSQRTHKCPVNPPGTVVRKTGDLLQKLLQSSSILPQGSAQEALVSDNPTLLDQTEVDSMGQEGKQTIDYVNRTLDELVRQTYNKLGNRSNAPSSTMYDLQAQQQLCSNFTNADQYKQPELSDPQPLQQAAETSSIDSNFPRIENLCLLSPSAFDSGQLGDLEGLKLDNNW